MSSELIPPEQFHLLSRVSSSSIESDDLEEASYEPKIHSKGSPLRERPLLHRRLRSYIPRRIRKLIGPSHHGPIVTLPRRSHYASRFSLCSLRRIFSALIAILAIIIAFTAIFRPSYTHPPARYRELKELVKSSDKIGRANPLNQKIFITASIYDRSGSLLSGWWGKSVLDLIDLLGHDNVFVSIYENDSGKLGESALQHFSSKLPCEHEIVYEDHLPESEFPLVSLPDGTERLKRMRYLAEVRNRALRPLDRPANVTYDRVLSLNDVAFEPLEITQLLFSTNAGSDGKADYLAACTMDFDNPFKFYDTIALRDLEGYGPGIIFYPWFSSAGKGQSRKDVLAQKDAVRVKSCWGGVVAFDAKYFQAQEPVGAATHVRPEGSYEIDPLKPTIPKGPVRFRSEPEAFHEASECCLIHADLLSVANRHNVAQDSGIYVNPYIRVAYDPWTRSWLSFSRRFERLYVFPQWLVNVIAGLPGYNPHRAVEPGQPFQEEVWKPDHNLIGNGSWQLEERTGRSGLYCGVRELQVIRRERKSGQKNWEMIRPLPRGQTLPWG